eukprot:GHVN01089379.1.p1 GENE.GHVN01089379.1~~GHVN01089379.1.p1  ORF type:complete len:368 (-),score=64.03 GHVN01089379.1:346-1449(-)
MQDSADVSMKGGTARTSRSFIKRFKDSDQSFKLKDEESEMFKALSEFLKEEERRRDLKDEKREKVTGSDHGEEKLKQSFVDGVTEYFNQCEGLVVKSFKVERCKVPKRLNVHHVKHAAPSLEQATPLKSPVSSAATVDTQITSTSPVSLNDKSTSQSPTTSGGSTSCENEHEQLPGDTVAEADDEPQLLLYRCLLLVEIVEKAEGSTPTFSAIKGDWFLDLWDAAYNAKEKARIRTQAAGDVGGQDTENRREIVLCSDGWQNQPSFQCSSLSQQCAYDLWLCAAKELIELDLSSIHVTHNSSLHWRLKDHTINVPCEGAFPDPHRAMDEAFDAFLDFTRKLRVPGDTKPLPMSVIETRVQAQRGSTD